MQERTPAAAPSRRSVLLLAASLTLLVFAVDQGTKLYVEDALRIGESVEVVPGFLSITYIENDGGAFGLLAGRGLVLLAGSAVAVAVVLWMLLAGTPTRLTAAACGMILGGAAGNLLDRLQHGAVTDYVHFSFWYIFNAADAAIVAGVVLLLLSSFLPAREKS